MDKSLEKENRFSFTFNKNRARNVIKSSVNTAETDPVQYYKKSAETLDEHSVPGSQKIAGTAFSDTADNALKNANDVDSLLRSTSIPDKVSGYQKLKTAFTNAEKSGNPDVFGKYADEIKTLPMILNPKVLKEAKECFKEFIIKCPETLLNGVIHDLFESVVVKLFGSNKFSEIGAELILSILSKNCQTDALLVVLEQIGVNNKNPMILATTVKLLLMSLKKSGPGLINPEFYQKHIESFFCSTNLSVRANAMELAKEMYRWGGTDFLNLGGLTKIKKSQMAAITTEIAAIRPIPAKLDSSLSSNNSPKTQNNLNTKTFSFSPPQTASNNTPNTINAKDAFIRAKTELNLLAELKIDHSFYQTLSRSNWSEKKEFLDMAAKKCKNARLTAFGADETAFVEAVGKLLRDVNVNVCVAALNVLTEVAKAAGARFEPCARKLFGDVVLKFRERRKGVGEACFEVLRAFSETGLTLDSVFEEITKGLKDKTSYVRESTLIWSNETLSMDPKREKLVQCVESFANLVVKLFDDSTETVRTESFKTFKTLQTYCGKNNFITELVETLKRKNLRAYTFISKPGPEPKILGKSEEALFKVPSKRKLSKGAFSSPNPTKKSDINPKALLSARFPSKTSKRFLESKIAIPSETETRLRRFFDSKDLESFKGDHVDSIKISAEKIWKKIKKIGTTDRICGDFLNFITDHYNLNNLSVNETIVNLLNECVKMCSEKLNEVDIFKLILKFFSVENPKVLFSNEASLALNREIRVFLISCCEVLGPEIIITGLIKIMYQNQNIPNLTISGLLRNIPALLSEFDREYFANPNELFSSLQTLFDRSKSDDEELKLIFKNTAKSFSLYFEKPIPAVSPSSVKKPLFSPEKQLISLEPPIFTPTKPLFSAEKLAEASDENSWQKRLSALKTIFAALERRRKYGGGVSEEEARLLIKLGEVLGKRMRDRIIMIARLAFGVLEEICSIAKDFANPQIAKNILSLSQDSLIHCLCSGNKQISACAEKSVSFWAEEVEFQPVAQKIAKTILNNAFSKTSKRFLLKIVLKIAKNRKNGLNPGELQAVSDILTSVSASMLKHDQSVKGLCAELSALSRPKSLTNGRIALKTVDSGFKNHRPEKANKSTVPQSVRPDRKKATLLGRSQMSIRRPAVVNRFRVEPKKPSPEVCAEKAAANGRTGAGGEEPFDKRGVLSEAKRDMSGDNNNFKNFKMDFGGDGEAPRGDVCCETEFVLPEVFRLNMENLRLYLSHPNDDQNPQKGGKGGFERLKRVSENDFAENGAAKQSAIFVQKENGAMINKKHATEQTESLPKRENMVSFETLKERMKRIGR